MINAIGNIISLVKYPVTSPPEEVLITADSTQYTIDTTTLYTIDTTQTTT